MKDSLNIEYHANNGYWGTIKGRVVRVFSSLTDTCIFSIRTDANYDLYSLRKLIDDFPTTLLEIERKFK
jgi:hypothetical protein